jgi:hypothetical protein
LDELEGTVAVAADHERVDIALTCLVAKVVTERRHHAFRCRTVLTGGHDDGRGLWRCARPCIGTLGRRLRFVHELAFTERDS